MKFFVAIVALAAAVCAEPEADPALLYAGAGYPYAAAAVASPLAYNAALPYAATYANAYPWAYGGAYNYAAPYYAARGFAYSSAALTPYAGYFGARVIAKRDAEAEADPALLYAGAGYAAPVAAYSGYAAPYAAYAGYPYAANYAYAGYPYAANYAYGAYPYGAYAAPYFGRFYA